MQISKPLNIALSLLIISACASAAAGRQCTGDQTACADEMSAPALPYLQASERTYPVGPLDKLRIDAGDVDVDVGVDGQRYRQDDEVSG